MMGLEADDDDGSSEEDDSEDDDSDASELPEVGTAAVVSAVLFDSPILVVTNPIGFPLLSFGVEAVAPEVQLQLATQETLL